VHPMAHVYENPRCPRGVLAPTQTAERANAVRMDTSEKETGSVETGTMVNRQRLAVLMVITALCVPAYADRGQDAFKHGDQAERKVDYDAAAAYYKQAYTLTPGNAKYFAAYMRIALHCRHAACPRGQLLRNTGALKEAMAEFQRGVEIDASSFIAQQELRQTADMIRRQERQRSTPKAESPLAKLADGMTDSWNCSRSRTPPSACG